MGFSLTAFRKKASVYKRSYRRFLTRLEKNTPRGLDRITTDVDREVWQETDCLECANCCKTMTPTYTNKDVKRIALHLDMTPQQFQKKWLKKERGTGDWINKTQPCQFLNLADNKCSIYEVRPVDCAGFPHLPKRRMVDYMHVHKQNIEFCPATFRMVEKIMQRLTPPAVIKKAKL